MSLFAPADASRAWAFVPSSEPSRVVFRTAAFSAVPLDRVGRPSIDWGENPEFAGRLTFRDFADEIVPLVVLSCNPLPVIPAMILVPAGAPCSMSRATSPSVTALLKSTTLVTVEVAVVIEIVMAAFRLMPLPPLIVLSSVSALTCGC